MGTAYVMVKSLTAEADRLQQEIASIEGVVKVHIVAGDVDLIAKVTGANPGEVKDIAVTNIHSLDGVDSTQTYMAMD